MVNRPEVLAIIPARGGSKGIPRKNIRSFAGYPLIAYSIAAAKQAGMVTRVILSTDDEEIAAVGKNYGAEVPFLRPEKLAQDDVLDLPVFQHILAWLAENEYYSPDVVVQLRPTSPIRPPSLVDDAVKLLLEYPEADSVRGVVPSGQNPHKMWRIDPTNGQMKPLLTVPGLREPFNAPRQSLPPTFWQTGHIDAIRTRVILEKQSMSGDVILPVMIDTCYTVDIDTLFDWQWYEWLVFHGGLEMVAPGGRHRPLPGLIELVVFDFDGVLTDNRVWVDEEGHEQISANRSDSLGLKFLCRNGIKLLVLSTETNSVVAARCKKMDVPLLQGVWEKADALKKYMEDHHIEPRNTIFVGNDINDTPCFPLVGCAVVVADAQSEAMQQADLVLGQDGGFGAVRELCDLIMRRNGWQYRI
jgi:N-acylneuraminate cytidylyltransferase